MRLLTALSFFVAFLSLSSTAFADLTQTQILEILRNPEAKTNALWLAIEKGNEIAGKAGKAKFAAEFAAALIPIVNTHQDRLNELASIEAVRRNRTYGTVLEIAVRDVARDWQLNTLKRDAYYALVDRITAAPDSVVEVVKINPENEPRKNIILLTFAEKNAETANSEATNIATAALAKDVLSMDQEHSERVAKALHIRSNARLLGKATIDTLTDTLADLIKTPEGNRTCNIYWSWATKYPAVQRKIAEGLSSMDSTTRGMHLIVTFDPLGEKIDSVAERTIADLIRTDPNFREKVIQHAPNLRFSEPIAEAVATSRGQEITFIPNGGQWFESISVQQATAARLNSMSHAAAEEFLWDLGTLDSVDAEAERLIANATKDIRIRELVINKPHLIKIPQIRTILIEQLANVTDPEVEVSEKAIEKLRGTGPLSTIEVDQVRSSLHKLHGAVRRGAPEWVIALIPELPRDAIAVTSVDNVAELLTKYDGNPNEGLLVYEKLRELSPDQVLDLLDKYGEDPAMRNRIFRMVNHQNKGGRRLDSVERTFVSNTLSLLNTNTSLSANERDAWANWYALKLLDARKPRDDSHEAKVELAQAKEGLLRTMLTKRAYQARSSLGVGRILEEQLRRTLRNFLAETANSSGPEILASRYAVITEVAIEPEYRTNISTSNRLNVLRSTGVRNSEAQETLTAMAANPHNRNREAALEVLGHSGKLSDQAQKELAASIANPAIAELLLQQAKEHSLGREASTAVRDGYKQIQNENNAKPQAERLSPEVANTLNQLRLQASRAPLLRRASMGALAKRVWNCNEAFAAVQQGSIMDGGSKWLRY